MIEWVGRFNYYLLFSQTKEIDTGTPRRVNQNVAIQPSLSLCIIPHLLYSDSIEREWRFASTQQTIAAAVSWKYTNIYFIS